MKSRLAAIVPAHNEELVIESTLQALLQVLPPSAIFLIDDCSKDNTVQLARKMIPNVLALRKNVGKAEAINSGIETFGLVNRFEFIVPVDADTRLGVEYVDNIVSFFDDPKHTDYVAVAGRVVGSDTNWLTSYRLWEYELGQTIHKQAQAKINAITVCPGCSTAYRSEVFKQLSMPTGTLTEDMDMTFQIHRNKIGKVGFAGEALVYTQDPQEIKDFIVQIDRWYIGLWQNISKHRAPFLFQRLDLELVIMATEGLMNGLFMSAFFVLAPFLIYTNFEYFILLLLAEIVIFSLPSLIYVAFKTKSVNILKYILHFLIIRIISSIVFLVAFIKVMFGLDSRLKWVSPTRYILQNQSATT